MTLEEWLEAIVRAGLARGLTEGRARDVLAVWLSLLDRGHSQGWTVERAAKMIFHGESPS